MEKVRNNIVDMVKKHPNGIPLKKLAVFYNQTYHHNLTLSSMGFDSVTGLVASLDKDLVVEGQQVFHKDHCHENRAVAIAVAEAVVGAAAKAGKDKNNTEKVRENIVAMMKEHPEGIPLNKLAIIYSQTYRQNLVLSSLGCKTISCLVASLKGDLVVSGEMVFHKIHQPSSQAVAGMSSKVKEDSRPATPQRTESVTVTPSVTMPQGDVSSHYLPPIAPQAAVHFLGPSLISTASIFSTHPVDTLVPASKPAETLTQEHLYERVLEVSRVD